MSVHEGRTIGIRLDYETRSGTEIKYGAYRYCEDPDFKMLVAAYTPIRQYPGGATKYGKVRVLDESDPTEVVQFRRIIQDPTFEKHAFNANFERVVSSKWIGMPDGTYLDPENWRCSAIQSNVHGVFGTLDEVGRAVRATVHKDPAGRRLINLFSKVDKKSGLFHEPIPTQGFFCWCGVDHEQDFRHFQRYCCQDVITEAVVSRNFPAISPSLQAEYEADQRINDRGIRHFRAMSVMAMRQVEVEKDRLMGELKAMTSLDNPNSGPQFHTWLDAMGYPMTSLDKDHREEALRDMLCPDEVREALVLKGLASLSSVTKHKAALNTRCKDGRIRGTLRYYGAHTGREAGKMIQPHNLAKYIATKADMRRLMAGTAGRDAPLIAKGTARAMLVPARDHVFVAVDENAIEARVLGNLTGEKWIEAEFAGEGKIYEATAERMFGADKARLIRALKTCGKCGQIATCPACALRSKAKVANLALGYAGGAGALVTMGAEEAGIDIGNYSDLHALWVEAGRPSKFHEWERDAHDYPELIRLRDLYREASPETVRFWKLCAKAFDVASAGRGARFGQHQAISMIRDGRHNRMVLPSGRSIWYRFARSHPSDTNPEYMDRRTFIGKSNGVGHVRTDTHGGKLCENVTQAVARDVLFDIIMKIEAETASGWPARLVLHVHDEVVLEVHKRHADQVLADTIGMMATPPSWAPTLVVKGEGQIMERYGK